MHGNKGSLQHKDTALSNSFTKDLLNTTITSDYNIIFEYRNWIQVLRKWIQDDVWCWNLEISFSYCFWNKFHLFCVATKIWKEFVEKQITIWSYLIGSCCKFWEVNTFILYMSRTKNCGKLLLRIGKILHAFILMRIWKRIKFACSKYN